MDRLGVSSIVTAKDLGSCTLDSNFSINQFININDLPQPSVNNFLDTFHDVLINMDTDSIVEKKPEIRWLDFKEGSGLQTSSPNNYSDSESSSVLLNETNKIYGQHQGSFPLPAQPFNQTELFQTIQLLSAKNEALMSINTQTWMQLNEKELDLRIATDSAKRFKQSLKVSNETMKDLSCQKDEMEKEINSLRSEKFEFEKMINQINNSLASVYQKVFSSVASSDRFDKSVGYEDATLRSFNNFSPISDVIEVDANSTLQEFTTAKAIISKMHNLLDREISFAPEYDPDAEFNNTTQQEFQAVEQIDIKHEWPWLRTNSNHKDPQNYGNEPIAIAPETFQITCTGALSTSNSPEQRFFAGHTKEKRFVLGRSSGNFSKPSMSLKHSRTKRSASNDDSDNIFQPSEALHKWDGRTKSREGFLWCLCGSRYSKKLALQNHISTQTQPACFVCESCNKQYMRISCLKKHMEMCHKLT